MGIFFSRTKIEGEFLTNNSKGLNKDNKDFIQNRFEKYFKILKK